jgi:hypothetical protein
VGDPAQLQADCRSDDRDQQYYALLELQKMRDEASLPDVTPLLLPSTDDSVRAAAAETVATLITLMRDDSSWIVAPQFGYSHPLTRPQRRQQLRSHDRSSLRTL